MRTTVLLLLTISLFLLSGSHEAEVRVPVPATRYSLLTSIGETQQIKFKNIGKDFSLNKLTNINQKKEELINFEDEEDELTFSNKHILIGMYFILFAYFTPLIYTYLLFKNRPPFCLHLSSCKYIQKTVLRI